MIEWQRFENEELLKYFSALQCCRLNSAFGCRLSLVQAYTLCDYLNKNNKHTRIINSIIESGAPTLEDPQEHCFIGVVNNHTASYRVFLSNLEGFCHQLSRLLKIADATKVDNEGIRKTKFLLTLSDILAERFDCQRYDIGVPKVEEIKELPNLCLNNVVFTKKQLIEILSTYDLSETVINDFLFIGSGDDVLKDLNEKHFANCIECYPLYKTYNGDYIVLQPSALLCTAFMEAFDALSAYHPNNLFVIYMECMSEIISLIVEEDDVCKLLNVVKDDFGITSLWYSFDNNKIANIVIALVEADWDGKICKFQEKTSAEIKKNFQDAEVFNITIYDNLHPDIPTAWGMMHSASKWQIDDFEVMMNSDRMSLLELFYYHRARSKERFFYSILQELDNFAYYKGNKSTFYNEIKKGGLIIPIGTALPLRHEYYKGKDYHVVKSRSGKYIELIHCKDIPSDVPIYTVRYLKYPLYVLEINKFHLSVKLISPAPFLKELMKSIMCLLVGLHRYSDLPVLEKDSYFQFDFSNDVEEPTLYTNQTRDDDFKLIFPEKFLEQEINEFSVFSRIVGLLRYSGILSGAMSDELVIDFISGIDGGFICYGKNTIDDYLVSYSGCYVISENSQDRVLEEIAHHLNWTSGKKKLTKEESIQTLSKSIGFIEKQLIDELKTMDTSFVLRKLMETYCSAIFWTRTSEARFFTINSAYKSIGSTFEKNSGFDNEYVKIKQFAQAIISIIVANNIHGVGKGCIEKVDTIFALTSQLFALGQCMDLLTHSVKGSEITMLDNGRIAFPTETLKKLNDFFVNQQREHRYNLKTLRLTYDYMPDYSFNYTDEKSIEAFIDEFGFDYECYNRIVFNCIEYANSSNNRVVSISQPKFEEIALSDLSDSAKKRFYQKCVLHSNLNLKKSDSYFQRYNRQNQMTTRPWMYYDNEIYFATNILLESLEVLNNRLSSGKFKAESPKMTSLMAIIGDKKGRMFTEKISEIFKEGNPLVVKTEVPIKPHANLDAPKDLGDIDVLLISKMHKLIICIEAKDYAESNSMYDAIRQLGDIKKSLRDKVSVRDKWCKENILKFKNICPDVTPEYRLKTVFLTHCHSIFDYLDDEYNFEHILKMSAIEMIENVEELFR